MSKKTWTMRAYEEGDEEQIRGLFELVFGQELEASRWSWQYRENYTDTIIITVAEGDGRELAGQYALRPTRMKIGDETRLGTLSLDTMVHPNYRRQGMFTKLAERTYEVAAKQGIPLTYGFPNQNSYRGFVGKLDWVDLCGRIPIFVKVLNTRNVLSKRIGNKRLLSAATLLSQPSLAVLYQLKNGGDLPLGYDLNKVSRFDDRLDTFWVEASTAYKILVARDTTYLNWRFVENPTEEYSILLCENGADVAGYMVLKYEEKFDLRLGFIVDVLTRSGASDLGTALISEAVTRFQHQADLVTCLMLEHTSQATALRRNGFVVVPEGFFPQELYLGVRRHTNEYSEEFITNPENWYITWADHDTV